MTTEFSSNISSTTDPELLPDLTDPELLSNLTTCKWCLHEGLVGPAIAVFVGIEFVLALIANSFIIIQTLSKGCKMLSKSSTVLLFNLALSNLIIAVFYLPFVVISMFAEEWIIGTSDVVRERFCEFNGFVYAYASSIALHTLAAVSFDRFLSIVQPHLHQRFMTWKTALGIVIFIWLYSILVDITPYLGPGLGEYVWAEGVTGGCIPNWVNNSIYAIYFTVLAIPPFIVIAVTSIWTFIFTKAFLKKNLERQKSTLNRKDLSAQKNIYTERVRNLVGIFGALLICNVVSWSPYFVTSIISLSIGSENLPVTLFASVSILYLLTNVTNPIVQIYFRKDLLNDLKKIVKSVGRLMCCVSESRSVAGEESSHAHSAHDSMTRQTRIETPEVLPDSDAKTRDGSLNRQMLADTLNAPADTDVKAHENGVTHADTAETSTKTSDLENGAIQPPAQI